ncbi:hypothetical protein V8G54_029500 [Vigna mungo]|uniref:Transposase (putative) gypsy type domain-containing protein n=1 Tax=Vigna mungo TaxID=3915 RepID=A0AAQ3MVD1_VIGMU
MDPFVNLDCSPTSIEERRRDCGVEAPETSFIGVLREITTVLSGVSAFLYGNVVAEDPSPSTPVLVAMNGIYTINERVFHGKENPGDDFFYAYSCLFYDMYVRLPFSVFQIDVLKTLNVAPSLLHPNNWGYIHAFAIMCQTLALRPTTTLFLHFFRARPIAKRGRPFFFNDDGSLRFPLYYTQDPIKFTSWSKDKRTTDELEDLKVLNALPRPFSYQKIFNCLEHDDVNSRCLVCSFTDFFNLCVIVIDFWYCFSSTAIMGKKSTRDWFDILDAKKNQGGTSRGGSSDASVPTPTKEKTIVLDHAERPPSPEVIFVRKHMVVQSTKDPKAYKKGRDFEGHVNLQADRAIPSGMRDLTFNLGHKIDFNFDEAEKKVIDGTSEQKMAETCLELACQVAAAAWTLAYAFNRGNFRIELEQVKEQLNKKDADKVIVEGRSIMENLQRAFAVIAEKDTLCWTVAEDQELKEETGEAIILEHTWGVKFDPRKDSLPGASGTFLDDEPVKWGMNVGLSQRQPFMVKWEKKILQLLLPPPMPS